MIRIVIVEDKKAVREGLAVLLGVSGDLSCVGRYPNAEDMLSNLATDCPDIVLMDIGLPGMSGIDATMRVKESQPATEVVILTIHEDDGNIFKALCAGACGYLLKDTPPADLVAAVADAHEGGSPMSSRIARRVVALFQDKFQPPRESEIRITEREQEVLSSLAKGNSYAAIADSLCVAADTVRFHIRNIYRKLHVHSQTAAVAKAIREDLI
ncbi:DNA-binding response regulator [bacterium]|nr:MAG: DNA-binding response regulator [bacterium]